MAAENNDSPSTWQQYFGFTTTRKRFEPGHNLLTFPIVHSAPLNTLVPIMEITWTLVVERLTLFDNGKSSTFIACSQLYPQHYLSLTEYPIASDIKPAHRILSLTHRKCRGKPNIRILPPLLNKYGHSQLYRDQIFSHTIYLYNRKFDWCLIVHPIWLA